MTAYNASMSRRRRYTRNLGRTTHDRVPKRGAGHRYVRFAHRTDPYGLFSYLNDARPRLSEPDRAELEAIVGWFNENLDEPDCMVPVRVAARGRRAENDAEPSAVCWFKATARAHVARARRMAILVRRTGIPIVELRRDLVPGQICSGDAAQIAAASFWG